jgi:hypothetical protein
MPQNGESHAGHETHTPTQGKKEINRDKKSVIINNASRHLTPFLSKYK